MLAKHILDGNRFLVVEPIYLGSSFRFRTYARIFSRFITGSSMLFFFPAIGHARQLRGVCGDFIILNIRWLSFLEVGIECVLVFIGMRACM